MTCKTVEPGIWVAEGDTLTVPGSDVKVVAAYIGAFSIVLAAADPLSGRPVYSGRVFPGQRAVFGQFSVLVHEIRTVERAWPEPDWYAARVEIVPL